jgi:hypothetical protein
MEIFYVVFKLYEYISRIDLFHMIYLTNDNNLDWIEVSPLVDVSLAEYLCLIELKCGVL